MSFKSVSADTMAIAGSAGSVAGTSSHRCSSGRDGLCDICIYLGAHKSQLYHLGIVQDVSHSTLPSVNENRDWRIYADFGSYLIGPVKPMYTENHASLTGIEREVFALDSTIISVSIVLMDWAHGKYSGRGKDATPY